MKIYKRTLINLLIIMILISNIFESVLPFFKYTDEIAVFIAIIYLIKDTKQNKDQLTVGICTVVLFFIGLYGTFAYKYNPSSLYIAVDIVSMLKYPVFSLVAYKILKDSNELPLTYFNLLIKFLKIFIIIALVFGIANIFVNIGMYTDYRYGLRAYNFIFSRVGDLYSFCINALMILFAHSYISKKNNMPYFVMLILIMAFTLRTRAVCYAFLFVGLYLCIFKIKNKHIIAALVILMVGLISFDQFEYYFLENANRARTLLLTSSMTVANKHIFGAGFASYGTGATINSYSELYYDLGFYRIWGLSPSYSSFLSDNYWPSIIGQYGYIGLFVNILLIVATFRLLKRHISNKGGQFLLIYFVVVMVFSSLVTSSFYSSFERLLALTVSLLMVKQNEISDSKLIKKSRRKLKCVN